MDRPVIATASSAARMVWQQEMDTSFGEALEQWQDAGDFTFYAPGDIQAPIASGTFPVHGMAIVPCSMSTVAALAHGFSDNLIRRAADVCIKERRPLTIVPRETPLSAIHLENMAVLARLGVTVLPPEPPFYLRPQSLDDVVAFVVNRTLASLGIIDALPDSMHDGVLAPTELIRRAIHNGYRVMAITDHVGPGNLEFVIKTLVKDCAVASKRWDILALPGVEITYVPKDDIDMIAREARALGAKVVNVHGETVVEPVEPGTNYAAVSSNHIDVLAHPGLITPEEAQMAAERGIFWRSLRGGDTDSQTGM
ncbi:Flavin prenyltransferase UbiX [Geodia barretti]|uniref:Flavin prenyltransferase UbiX n=1 Tax=Geodia barretti TaxID=519541 RepID=A0AA35SL95_GEOBA|nr:Flavin prenyltransferase UbiX [Geodia barretti]